MKAWQYPGLVDNRDYSTQDDLIEVVPGLAAEELRDTPTQDVMQSRSLLSQRPCIDAVSKWSMKLSLSLFGCGAVGVVMDDEYLGPVG